ncbi:MAG: nucleotidyl transferase AbiEii/AbiGii toxin family protein, partial [Candidatus Omnitrophica bacterium]|nr:nucleotidyl transferase AbiEii/AbiGii toxin family protein [Candidatus Omnitrophota bacterium]
MNTKLREVQKKVLRVFAANATDFALAGGTALELYYLHHRFSADLDFFSKKYKTEEIKDLITAFQKTMNAKIRLETQCVAAGRAAVRFYTIPIKGLSRPLKIDFIEDVYFEKPDIRKIEGVRVYSAENIYLQKIIAIAGIEQKLDEIGRPILGGRKEARDVFDVCMLSQRIEPLHSFLNTLSRPLQRGMIHWYRTFSRHDVRLALMDLDIYDKQFDTGKMIAYLEHEIQQ